jgi:hypothetical protein
MAEELLNPIPRVLCDAFWGAIGQYNDWCRGQPEPEVSVDGRPFTISAVCDFVSKFGDLMPAERWDLLAGVSRSGDELPNDQSYGSGARFLAHLIREKKARFEE